MPPGASSRDKPALLGRRQCSLQRLPTAALLAGLCWCGLGCHNAREALAPRIKLQERRTYSVPTGFDLAGAAFAGAALQNLMLSPDGSFRSALAEDTELALQVQQSSPDADFMRLAHRDEAPLDSAIRNCLGFIMARIVNEEATSELRAELSELVI